MNKKKYKNKIIFIFLIYRIDTNIKINYYP